MICWNKSGCSLMQSEIWSKHSAVFFRQVSLIRTCWCWHSYVVWYESWNLWQNKSHCYVYLSWMYEYLIKCYKLTKGNVPLLSQKMVHWSRLQRICTYYPTLINNVAQFKAPSLFSTWPKSVCCENTNRVCIRIVQICVVLLVVVFFCWSSFYFISHQSKMICNRVVNECYFGYILYHPDGF